jgi:flagellar motor switch protein FliM
MPQLSQAEVDALVAAVEDGTFTNEDKPAPVAPDGRTYKPYDFRHPSKFSSEQLRTLQAIHENVGSVAAARLSSFLRIPVAIGLVGTDQRTFEDYEQNLQLPSQLVVMASNGMAGPFMIDFDLGFALAAVDRLLGGPGRVPPKGHEPTPIEANLISRIVGHLPPALVEGWSHLQALDVEVTESALTPILLRVAAPTEVVAIMEYELRFAGPLHQEGLRMTICYPFASLEPLLPRLAATMWYAQRRQTDASGSCREIIENEMRAMEIPVAASFRAIDLPLETLWGLRIGDIIRFDEKSDEPIDVDFAGQARAMAIPGRVGDRVALQLVTPLCPMEA